MATAGSGDPSVRASNCSCHALFSASAAAVCEGVSGSHRSLGSAGTSKTGSGSSRASPSSSNRASKPSSISNNSEKKLHRQLVLEARNHEKARQHWRRKWPRGQRHARGWYRPEGQKVRPPASAAQGSLFLGTYTPRLNPNGSVFHPRCLQRRGVLVGPSLTYRLEEQESSGEVCE